MSNPKLTDVAQLAAVSPATVSRAINQPAIVNAKTLERIQQAIQQIGYETNTAGRNLRLRRSDALLVMISDAPSRFFSQILMGVEAEASESWLQRIGLEYPGQSRKGTSALRKHSAKSSRWNSDFWGT